jgi:hypothetical protein
VSVPPPESPFRQVLHEAPKLSVAERLGSLGLALDSSNRMAPPQAPLLRATTTPGPDRL